MMYDDIFELNNLKSVKWYNFITRYKNYKLYTNIINKIMNNILYIVLDNKSIYDIILDSFITINAISKLYNPDIVGISVCNYTAMYDHNLNRIDVLIKDTNLDCDYIEIKIHRNFNNNKHDQIQISYKIDNFVDTFYIYKYPNEILGANNYSILNINSTNYDIYNKRLMAISNLRTIVSIYMKEALNSIYTLFTRG